MTVKYFTQPLLLTVTAYFDLSPELQLRKTTFLRWHKLLASCFFFKVIEVAEKETAKREQVLRSFYHNEIY